MSEAKENTIHSAVENFNLDVEDTSNKAWIVHKGYMIPVTPSLAAARDQAGGWTMELIAQHGHWVGE